MPIRKLLTKIKLPQVNLKNQVKKRVKIIQQIWTFQ